MHIAALVTDSSLRWRSLKFNFISKIRSLLLILRGSPLLQNMATVVSPFFNKSQKTLKTQHTTVTSGFLAESLLSLALEIPYIKLHHHCNRLLHYRSPSVTVSVAFRRTALGRTTWTGTCRCISRTRWRTWCGSVLRLVVTGPAFVDAAAVDWPRPRLEHSGQLVWPMPMPGYCRDCPGHHRRRFRVPHCLRAIG